MFGMKKWMAVGAAALLFSAGVVQAKDPIKVGVIYAMSGPFAAGGTAVATALKVFQEKHGTSVAGREVEFIFRDSTGPAPDVAARLATELVTRDHVSMLTGLDFSPNAIAIAQVANRANLPVIAINATALPFLQVAKYGARISYTQSQVTSVLAKWEKEHDNGKVFTVVADFLPGVEAEQSFVKTYTRLGGVIAGSLRVPVANPDFAPFLQRVRESKADKIYLFLPAAGDLPTLFFRAFKESGLAKDGVKVIGTGETNEIGIHTLGGGALGVVTAYHYSSAHDSPANKEFVAAYEKLLGGKMRADFGAAEAYDTFSVIYQAIAAQNGDVTAEGTIKAIRGHTFEGVRGHFTIDDKGEISQTVYLRKVEDVNGRLENVEFDKVEKVPGNSEH